MPLAKAFLYHVVAVFVLLLNFFVALLDYQVAFLRGDLTFFRLRLQQRYRFQRLTQEICPHRRRTDQRGESGFDQAEQLIALELRVRATYELKELQVAQLIAGLCEEHIADDGEHLSLEVGEQLVKYTKNLIGHRLVVRTRFRCECLDRVRTQLH